MILVRQRQPIARYVVRTEMSFQQILEHCHHSFHCRDVALINYAHLPFAHHS